MTTLQDIYSQINAFRRNPERFNASCEIPFHPLSELQILPSLERESRWQATHQCEPVSHQTCEEYCYLFGDKCDHIARIKTFVFPDESTNETEVLVKGPRHPFKHLVAKRGHCEHLLDPDVNAMGGAIVGNLFVLAMLWLK